MQDRRSGNLSLKGGPIQTRRPSAPPCPREALLVGRLKLGPLMDPPGLIDTGPGTDPAAANGPAPDSACGTLCVGGERAR